MPVCQKCTTESLSVELFRLPIGLKNGIPRYKEFRLCPTCIAGICTVFGTTSEGLNDIQK